MKLTKEEQEMLNIILENWYPYWMEDDSENSKEDEKIEKPLWESLKRKLIK